MSRELTYPDMDAPEMIGSLDKLRERIAFDPRSPRANLAEVDAACEHWLEMREPARRTEAETLLGCGNSVAPPLSLTARVETFAPAPTTWGSETANFDANLLNGPMQREMWALGTMGGTCAGTKIYTGGGWRNFYGGDLTTSPYS